ncbi:MULTISPECIES: carbohydrate ABC transporter permease [Gemmiger]|uniref:carbohydrate ABC transporter permease n=1 Tax=Gemmiger TaxID=204475 RepID=UPI0022E226E7|nr:MULTISPECIES: sugar ABC transporter permease [Gemmiger]MDY5604357.1 sugar ABC transporter permease [Gemmiger sp.]
MNKSSKSLAQTLNQEHVAGLVCTSPFIIGLFAFLLIPMGMSLYYSLCNYSVLSTPTFAGFKNYVNAFTADPLFWTSMKVTFFFALVSVPLRLVFALIVALLLQKTSKANAFYRAAYYLPSIIGGSVAVSILWKRMFATDGVINQILGTNYPFLGNTSTAIWTLILLSIWQFGSSMLIFLSALKQIPASLYEAAEIDGANKVRTFFKITLPLLTPTIFFNLVMQMINGFLAFTQCYIITQGKPMNSTLFYTVYMYQQSFEFYNTGYGAALAWIMLMVIGTITAILFATKKFWVYEGGI